MGAKHSKSKQEWEEIINVILKNNVARYNAKDFHSLVQDFTVNAHRLPPKYPIAIGRQDTQKQGLPVGQRLLVKQALLEVPGYKYVQETESPQTNQNNGRQQETERTGAPPRSAESANHNGNLSPADLFGVLRQASEAPSRNSSLPTQNVSGPTSADNDIEEQYRNFPAVPLNDMDLTHIPYFSNDAAVFEFSCSVKGVGITFKGVGLVVMEGGQPKMSMLTFNYDK